MRALRIKFVGKYIVMLMLTGLLSACASGPSSYEQNIRSAVSGSGNITILKLDDNVVILSGWVDSASSRAAVHRAALVGHEGEVFNRILVTN